MATYPGYSKSRNEELKMGKLMWYEEIGRMYIAFYSANCWHFCYCSHQMWWESHAFVTVCTKGLYSIYIYVCKGIASWLVSWWFKFASLSLLNAWIVHNMLQLSTKNHSEASSVSCFIREPFVSNTCSTVWHALFNASIIQVDKCMFAVILQWIHTPALWRSEIDIITVCKLHACSGWRR